MKRLVTFAITLTLLTTLLAGTNENAHAGPAPQLLSGILQKMENAHRSLKSLKASVVQKRVNSQLGVGDTDYGTLIYKPLGNGRIRMRLDYIQPDKRTAAVDGDNFTYYQPRINQAFKGALSKATKGKNSLSGLLAGFNGSARSLTASYMIDYVREEQISGQMTYQLRLTPKEKSSVASIEVWVSSDTWLPVQTRTVEKNGDYSVLRMDRMELNARLDDSAFNVKLPPGTAIVDKL
jgi:outer membrane lipoprotein-sorting protein